MSIYSNTSTYGGSTSHRPHSHSHPQSYHPQGSVQGPPGQIYGAPGVGNHGRPGGAGYANYQPGPPAGADPQLWQWFQAVDGDRSGAITVSELQTALVNGERCE